MLLQAFAVGEHLEADVTLLRFCPGGNGFDAGLVEVNYRVKRGVEVKPREKEKTA